MRRHRNLYPSLLAFAVPVSVLLFSAFFSPYLFVYDIGTTALNENPDAVQFLSRLDSLSLYYTGADLLYPEPGEYDAVVFDLPVVVPASSDSAKVLPTASGWIPQIRKALHLTDGLGNALPDLVPSPRDVEVSETIPDDMYSKAAQPGQYIIYDVPIDSGYRRFYGIEAFVAVAIQWQNFAETPSPSDAAIDNAATAFGEALRECSRRGIRRLAVPFIEVRSTATTLSREDAWFALLNKTVDTARRNGIRKMVFGGRSVGKIRTGLKEVDHDFKFAFAKFVGVLRTKSRVEEPMHATLRLAAVADLAAVIRFRRRRIRWQTMVLLILAAVAIAEGVLAAFGKMTPLLSPVNSYAVLFGETLVASLAGYFVVELERLKEARIK